MMMPMESSDHPSRSQLRTGIAALAGAVGYLLGVEQVGMQVEYGVSLRSERWGFPKITHSAAPMDSASN